MAPDRVEAIIHDRTEPSVQLVTHGPGVRPGGPGNSGIGMDVGRLDSGAVELAALGVEVAARLAVYTLLGGADVAVESDSPSTVSECPRRGVRCESYGSVCLWGMNLDSIHIALVS